MFARRLFLLLTVVTCLVDGIASAAPKPAPPSSGSAAASSAKPASGNSGLAQRPVTFSGQITQIVSLAWGDRGPIPPQLTAIVVSNGATTSQFSVGPWTKVVTIIYFGNSLPTGQYYRIQPGTLANLQVGLFVNVYAQQGRALLIQLVVYAV